MIARMVLRMPRVLAKDWRYRGARKEKYRERRAVRRKWIRQVIVTIRAVR